jgi:uncharacterized protein with HEPN domain
MKRSVRSRLNDIMRAIDGAAETIGGADFETFQSTFYMSRTIERCVEIVSEATRHVPEEFRARHPEIPWRQIAGVGNVLRHDYERIDQRIMWEIATVQFPRLRLVIMELIREANDEK